ncbi:MAG: helix-turn-helix domain-containing protein [Egibacteraceae bacterium]
MHGNATASASPDGRLTWTARETAARLGIKLSTVYAYVEDGVLPSVRLRGRLLIPCAAVEYLVDQAMDRWGGPDVA